MNEQCNANSILHEYECGREKEKEKKKFKLDFRICEII